MRRTFVRTLTALAEDDPRILLLTGDLGFSVVEPFRDRFPDRFYNVGVAEQNMVGLATGLAEAGFIPFVYSIATFASLRPYEFIRNGPVLHRLPVRVVGVGGGFEYGAAGPTHHGLEDIGAMRLQRGLNVIAPADHLQAAAALRSTWDLSGPIYFRLGKDDRTEIPGLEGRFRLGRCERIREGDHLAIVATGPITVEALGAAQDLARDGIEARVLVLASISPEPVEDLCQALEEMSLVLVAETHGATGGVGSLVCEVVAEHGLACRVVRCAVRSELGGLGGGEAWLNRREGLSRTGLAQAARRALDRVTP